MKNIRIITCWNCSGKKKIVFDDGHNVFLDETCPVCEGRGTLETDADKLSVNEMNSLLAILEEIWSAETRIERRQAVMTLKLYLEELAGTYGQDQVHEAFIEAKETLKYLGAEVNV